MILMSIAAVKPDQGTRVLPNAGALLETMVRRWPTTQRLHHGDRVSTT